MFFNACIVRQEGALSNLYLTYDALVRISKERNYIGSLTVLMYRLSFLEYNFFSGDPGTVFLLIFPLLLTISNIDQHVH